MVVVAIITRARVFFRRAQAEILSSDMASRLLACLRLEKARHRQSLVDMILIACTTRTHALQALCVCALGYAWTLAKQIAAAAAADKHERARYHWLLSTRTIVVVVVVVVVVFALSAVDSSARARARSCQI